MNAISTGSPKPELPGINRTGFFCIPEGDGYGYAVLLENRAQIMLDPEPDVDIYR